MRTHFSDTDILQLLHQPAYAHLREQLYTLRYASGNMVTAGPQDPNSIFLVESGRLRVYLAYGDKEFTLAHLRAGDIYSTHPRTLITTLEPTVLHFIPTHRFQGWLQKTPQLGTAVLRVLGEMLGQTFTIIEGLAFKDITCRLAELLLHEVRRNGAFDGTGYRVDMGLTIEQMASILGSSRQTVSTQLNELERSGLLEKLGRGTYRVLNTEALAACCPIAGPAV
ncbi:MAG: Crp/Fnr family transcriptional regulator [Desulfohalobium sp.]